VATYVKTGAGLAGQPPYEFVRAGWAKAGGLGKGVGAKGGTTVKAGFGVAGSVGAGRRNAVQVEAGAGKAGLVASGVRVGGSQRTYLKAGWAKAGGLGKGVSAHLDHRTKAGAGLMGQPPYTREKVGYATAGALGRGSRAGGRVVFLKTGLGKAVLVGSGRDVFIAVKLGRAVVSGFGDGVREGGTVPPSIRKYNRQWPWPSFPPLEGSVGVGLIGSGWALKRAAGWTPPSWAKVGTVGSGGRARIRIRRGAGKAGGFGFGRTGATRGTATAGLVGSGVSEAILTARAVDFVEIGLETNGAAPSIRRLLPVKSFQVHVQPLGYSMDEVARNLLTALPSVVAGTSWRADLQSRCYPGDLPFMLAAAGWDYVRVLGDDPDGRAIPADVAVWRFVRRTTRSLRTWQVRLSYAREGVVLLLRGGAIETISLGADGEVGGSLRGLRVTRDTLVTTSEFPADPRMTPFVRSRCRITFGSGAADLNDFALHLETPLRVRSLPNGAPSYPTLVEHANERGRTSGTMSLVSLNAGDLDYLMSGATFAASASWGSASTSTIDPTYTHKAWADLPACQYREVTPDPLRGGRRRSAKGAWQAHYDTASGREATLTVACSALDLE